ncbi:MAG: transcription-repair coupling factor [Rickettsiales bacterium]
MPENLKNIHHNDDSATGMPQLNGVPTAAEPLAVRALIEGAQQPVIFVALNDRHMQRFLNTAHFFLPNTDILSFPAWDTLPYDRSSPHNTISAERLKTLAYLASRQGDNKAVVVTTVNALLQRILPRDVVRGSSLHLKKGGALYHEEVIRILGELGYHRAGKVMEPGEFAFRGSLIDLFPAGANEPFRIDVFGDEIESIRPFDPLSQRTTGDAENIHLLPVSELMLNESRIEHFRERYRSHFGPAQKEDALYAAASAGQHYPGMEHWLPFFYPKLESLLDYLPGARLVLAAQSSKTIAEREETILDYYQSRQINSEHKDARKHGNLYFPVPPREMYFLDGERVALLEKGKAVECSPFAGSGNATDLGFRGGKNIYALAKAKNSSPAEMIASELAVSEKAIVLAAETNGSAERIGQMIASQKISAFDEVSGKGPFLAVLPLEQGFSTPLALFVSEEELLGARLQQTRKKKKPTEAFMAEAAAFDLGELLVHRDHGIGKFDGLVTVEVSGAKHDCLKLVYKDDDRLFLPVENMDLVSRYGSEGENAELDKLGASQWQARKAKMKERIRMAAEELMHIAAARALKPGTPLAAQAGLYDEFTERFGYMETEDQARAIEDVKEDLHSGRPMDRLICGDVGFGKTEVALRAAFIAVNDTENVAQVALVCPTTLLARQHYHTFKKRFEGLGIKIGMLSRLTAAKEAREIKDGLYDGSVKIVVGTHALLAESIQFQNLGLLIVDEEQHFGVKQKERLKQLKANVHVLTLSATPIPRTLQLSLSGVKELSLITTPPVDRLAVRTFVLPFDEVVIREAIQREMHRGGQVFYVAPRISDLTELRFKIEELVPGARLAVAHGQLPPTTLDKLMNAFYDGQYDILLSTAIVESGIDIPTANTMIIHRADRFGLSQLYQLRGRVGRSKTRAYCYLTLPHQKTLTANAVKRLEVMQTLDTLGAGFQLASHDMDIRGFGNLLGEEQSGHIREVGIELYQQMLEDAIQAQRQQHLKEEKVAPDQERFSPQINMGLTLMIPETYIEDLSLRLSLYRRMSSLESEQEIEAFAAEMVDRFGPVPTELENLFAVLRIKRLCVQACIERIDVGPKGAILAFHNNLFANPEALIGYIARHADTMKLRGDQKLLVKGEFEGSHVLRKVRDMVANIAKLA